MKILFERSGGFVGNTVSSELDTSTLPEEEARAISQLLLDTHFFDLPPKLSKKTMPDSFEYQLVVEESGKQHMVRFNDATAPEELRPLIQRLTRLSRQQPPTKTADQDSDTC